MIKNKKLFLRRQFLTMAGRLISAAGFSTIFGAWARAQMAGPAFWRNRKTDPGFALTFQGGFADDSDLTTYTFTNVPIGTPSDDRLVIIGTSGNAGSGRAFSSGTINGLATTKYQGPSGDWQPSGLFGLVVPTGTTANITATYTGGLNRCRIHVFTLTGYLSATPYHTAGSHTAASTSHSVTINIPANGVAVFTHSHGNSNLGTWSSATAKASIVLEGGASQSASKTVTTAITGHVESISWSGSAGRSTIAASWAPKV